MNTKYIIFGIIGALILGLLAWVYQQTTIPIPGQKLEALSRNHVSIGTAVEYNSNPPTSGDHYANWVKAGIYETPYDDRNLVHSLEHGYIIVSYNCDYGIAPREDSLTPSVTPSQMTTSNPEASSGAALSENFQSDECKQLVGQLSDVFNRKGPHKMIVIPRPTLDSKIALTAWAYLDKFNDFSEDRINQFTDAHRDLGPEQTME
jgi:hypothetical protein